MTKIYKIWCEWDIGHDSAVFTSKSAAYLWLYQNQNVIEMAAEEKLDPQHWVDKMMNDEHLIGFEILELEA